jgi:sortase A
MSEGSAAEQPTAAPSGAVEPSRAGRRTRRRARLSPLTVIGELLFVSGLAIVGYFGWQYLNTEVVVVGKQQELSSQDSARWEEAASAEPQEPWDGVVPVVPPVQPAEVFGVLYVPAFGSSYANRMAETTDWWTVLNLDEKGIGHYENTQMPGEPGNFAVAGHRSGPLINSFREVMNLRLGDQLYIETELGWYTYRFRSIEYVLPSEVDVLNPFPRLEGTPGQDQILTLTTCHPKEAGSDERAIAYAVFEGFQPRSEGPPASLAEINPNVGKMGA